MTDEIPICRDRGVVEGRVEHPARTTSQSFAFGCLFVDETLSIARGIREVLIDVPLVFARVHVESVGEVLPIQLTTMVGGRGDEDVAEGRHRRKDGEKTDQEELTFLVETEGTGVVQQLIDGAGRWLRRELRALEELRQ